MGAKRNVLLFWLLSLSVIAHAQRIDIGFRINYIHNNYQENYFDRLDMPGNSIDRNTISSSGDIVIDAVRNENNIYRIRVGYQKILIASRDEYNYTDGRTRINNGKGDFFEYDFAVGAGKLYDFEKITFKIGLELLFNISTRWNISYNIDELDSNGNSNGNTKMTFDEPAHYSGGIGTFSGVYYNFWKSFSAGFELGNYLLYAKKKGPITKEYEYYDANGNLLDTETINDEIDYRGFNTSFLNISLGLVYKF